MAYTIGSFQFSSVTVRTVTDGDVVWFVAADVAAVLEYSGTDMVTRHASEAGKILYGSIPCKDSAIHANTVLISESALYVSVIRSNKPNAEPFTKWVTSEVLPSIRRTGNYSIVNKPLPLTPLEKLALDNSRLLNEVYELRAQLVAERTPRYVTAREYIAERTGIPVSQLTRKQVMHLVNQLPADVDCLTRSTGKRYRVNDEVEALLRGTCRTFNLPIVNLNGSSLLTDDSPELTD